MPGATSARPELLWTGSYRDERGTESVSFISDGSSIRASIRGVAVSGRAPDMLRAVQDLDPDRSSGLSFRDGVLWYCLISIDIPVSVLGDRSEKKGTLRVAWNLDHSADKVSSGVPRLIIDGEVDVAAGSEDFEVSLPQIGEKLPRGSFLKTCINCQFSDYSPAGTASFGSMFCYRTLKAEYLAAKSKDVFFQLEERAERTQEIFVCPEFERRTPGTGYRG